MIVADVESLNEEEFITKLRTCRRLFANGFTVVVKQQIRPESLLSAGDELGVAHPFLGQRTGDRGAHDHHAVVTVLVRVRVHVDVVARTRFIQKLSR